MIVIVDTASKRLNIILGRKMTQSAEQRLGCHINPRFVAYLNGLRKKTFRARRHPLYQDGKFIECR